MPGQIRNELDLFHRFIEFTYSYIDYENGNANSTISVNTLSALEDVIAVVATAKKKKNFKFMYAGGKLIDGLMADPTGKTFSEIKQIHKKRLYWPHMRECLKCFVDAAKKREILLTGHEMEIVVGTPLVYKRLTVPIQRRSGNSLVVSAFVFNK